MIDQILLTTSYETFTPESLENGECEDCGMLDDAGTEYTFRELVHLLRHTEPSCYPLECDDHAWFSLDLGCTDYSTGEETRHSYHACNRRAQRYMVKAWKYANRR